MRTGTTGAHGNAVPFGHDVLNLDPQVDDTSRQLVEYALNFSESDLTPDLIPGIGITIIDSMSALITGFESEIMQRHQPGTHAPCKVT